MEFFFVFEKNSVYDYEFETIWKFFFVVSGNAKVEMAFSTFF